MTIATSVLCPVLIGRAKPLAMLEQHLANVREGQGYTLLVAGEAGIGKSRFCAEARARAMDLAIMQGHSFEQDHAYPYAPFIDMLQTWLEGQDPAVIATLLGDAAPELIKIVPAIGRWLPEVVPASHGDPEEEKRRLFPALVEVILGLPYHQPTILIIEDIHWSDAISREFILFLARQTQRHPLLLLVTFRNDELDGELSHLLATIQRERLGSEIALTSLGEDDINAMLRAMLRSHIPLPAAFLQLIAGSSEGNPFFVEEIVNALIAAGDIYVVDGVWQCKAIHEMHLPATVRDAVMQRCARLSATSRALLDVIAVAGRRFDFTLLAAVTGHAEDTLLQYLKEMIAVQLVGEESADVFAFRHALMQQTIYQELLVRERKGYHRAIAVAIERVFANMLDSHLSDLAFHFYEAGEWEFALTYAQRIGIQAQMLYAPHAAVAHFTRALTAAAHLLRPPPVDLLHARGQAFEMLGEFDLAKTDYLAMLAEAKTQKDQQTEWQALVALGMLWAGRDYAQTGAYYHAAYSLAETMGSNVLLANSLNRIGNWHLNMEEPGEAQRCHHAALGIFEAQDNAIGIAETCDFLGMAYVLGADLVQGAVYYRQAIAHFRALDHRQGLVSSLATLPLTAMTYQCSTMVPTMTLSQARQFGEEARQVAHAISQRSGEAYAEFNLGCVLGPQGKWAQALHALTACHAIAEEIEHRQWHCASLGAMSRLRQDMLDLPLARELAEQALALARDLNSRHWIHAHAGYLVSICVQQGDLNRASTILEAISFSETTMPTLGQRLLWCARIEFLLENHQMGQALHSIEQLLVVTPYYDIAHRVPYLNLLYGKALMANGRRDAAIVEWEESCTVAQDNEAIVVLWRLQTELAQCYQQTHNREMAKAVSTAARANLRHLAAEIDDETTRTNFLHHSEAMLPLGRQLSANRAMKERFDGLTMRERTVARLIAQGHSNRELATMLIVSERTIETHVSNILSKLNFMARTQIATWAISKDLLEDE